MARALGGGNGGAGFCGSLAAEAAPEPAGPSERRLTGGAAGRGGFAAAGLAGGAGCSRVGVPARPLRDGRAAFGGEAGRPAPGCAGRLVDSGRGAAGFCATDDAALGGCGAGGSDRCGGPATLGAGGRP